MNEGDEQLERLWDALLSRQPDLIKAANNSLRANDQKAVLAHLKRMISEAGWQPEQRQSAQAALEVLVTQQSLDK
jgi:hypothetical protein